MSMISVDGTMRRDRWRLGHDPDPLLPARPHDSCDWHRARVPSFADVAEATAMTERPMCTCKGIDSCPVHSVGGDVLNAREQLLVDTLHMLIIAITMPTVVLSAAIKKAQLVLDKVEGRAGK
jgi:hypothetical protein